MHQILIFVFTVSISTAFNDTASLNTSNIPGKTTIVTVLKKYSNESHKISEKAKFFNESEKANVHNRTKQKDIKIISMSVKHKPRENETRTISRQSVVNDTQKPVHILYRIHATVTRSKDAVWATITLTFLCVLLVISVAQSRMWKDYYGFEPQGIPLPNFNERVLFKDVMKRKIIVLKELFKKRKKENQPTELESLLTPSELEQ